LTQILLKCFECQQAVWVRSMPRKPAPSFRSKKAIIAVAVCVLFSALNLAAQNQVFKGTITDSTCAGPKGHTAMSKTGESLADCTIACVKMGAKFVLSSPQNKTLYQLDDQAKPKAFAAKNVLVVGTLNKTTSTIHVSDMVLALSAKVTQAKSVYIDCDACVRGMVKAKQAALDVLLDWKRFSLVQDPQKADLILLFSPNTYLGDYVTRHGPDTRPVRVFVTHMDVIDPRTGESLWGDSRNAGSWRVAGATKDLIAEFRGRLDAEDGHVNRLLEQNEKPTSFSSGDSGVLK
jgi:hypothetical protein